MAALETKEKILDAAEGLFAEHGFAATSLRNVVAAAGVNLAAVNYHFGSKNGLIRAVFARRVGPMNQERLRLLRELEDTAAEGIPSVEDMARALVLPAVSLVRSSVEEAPALSGLFGRLHTEADEEVRNLVFDQFAEVIERYIAALQRALPEIPLDELFCRFHFTIGAMAATLADPAALRFVSHGHVHGADDMETVTVRLIRFVSGGLSAPAAEQAVTSRDVGERHGGVARADSSRRPGGKT